MKRFTGLGLSLILAAVLVLSACGKSSETGTGNPASPPESGAPVELSVFAPQSAGIESLDVNPFSKHIEEKLGITFKWNTTPDAVFNDKKLLMLASGDYPALIMNAGISKADQIKYGMQGAFIPLNDLIDQHAPNIKKAMEEVSYLKSAMTAPDGNIYALPKVNECLHCTYGQRMWINTTWLEKLGLEMPTTTDEFYEVLKAFKEQDPNGNGKADEIPMTTSLDVWGGGVDAFLMNAFIYNNGTTYLSVKDGKVILSAAESEWKEGLKYLNKLYSEGLIDKGAFTQNGDAVKQLGNKADNVVGAVGYALISSVLEPTDAKPRHKEYDVVPPLKGPNGVQLAGYSVGAGDGSFVITNKATEEQRIAAIKLADYLFSEEGTVMTSWGFEGDGWRKAESGALDYNGELAAYEALKRDVPEGSLDVTWWQLGTMLMVNSLRESFVAPEDPLGNGAYEYRLWLAAKKYEPFAKPELVYPTDVFIDPKDATFIAQIQKTIQDYVKSNLAQFVTGSKDIEKDWDAYVSGFKGLQLDKYLEIHQKALDNQG
ncbi:ABC transporter substrate-binding protein [Paenibacillus sp. Y412MC10]|uniref:ABC transporter substrate-binding protein n=1 Tax=Geobacillus sp. (strain Y412MC10) TaxID=481743 RepID=UPI00119FEEB7|nr:ABC transporter substrate-binding protein [Paenibacillus sp. Y412MC10]